jgi:hypothetical protein
MSGNDYEPLLARLPLRARRVLGWLLRPRSRWVRIPAGLGLIALGLFGFLPVLGFWMIPLGGLLLAEDLPFLRPPMYRLLHASVHGWERLRQRVGRWRRAR